MGSGGEQQQVLKPSGTHLPLPQTSGAGTDSIRRPPRSCTSLDGDRDTSASALFTFRPLHSVSWGRRPERCRVLAASLTLTHWTPEVPPPQLQPPGPSAGSARVPWAQSHPGRELPVQAPGLFSHCYLMPPSCPCSLALSAQGGGEVWESWRGRRRKTRPLSAVGSSV